MDLRQYKPKKRLIRRAKRVLNYQPFIITDNFQTGVGYSFCHCKDPRVSPPLIFIKKDWSSKEWVAITERNQELAQMYDDQIKTIADLFPGHSLLDIACNNGYFPVAAELAGMKGCAGIDLGDYASSVETLNQITGSCAKFYHWGYDPLKHGCKSLMDRKGNPMQYDVVCASAILCHLPDPQYFLKFLADHARSAVFFWGQVLNSKQFIISYNPPHQALSSLTDFPNNFNDNTRVSYALLKAAMGWLGFSHILEFKYQKSWIKIPEKQSGNLEEEIKSGSTHRSFLFLRQNAHSLKPKQNSMIIRSSSGRRTNFLPNLVFIKNNPYNVKKMAKCYTQTYTIDYG